jgi:type II secretory pathway component PulC
MLKSQREREQRKLPPVIVVAASPDPNAPIMIPAPPVAPAPVKAPEPPPPPKIIDETHKVSRAEFDTYLGDFDRLLREARVSEAAGGGFVFDFLDAKSWLYKMGLRQGDIVLSIAGDRVSSVEDAARVYAKLLKIKKFTVEIDRSGQRMNLHYDLSKP